MVGNGLFVGDFFAPQVLQSTYYLYQSSQSWMTPDGEVVVLCADCRRVACLLLCFLHVDEFFVGWRECPFRTITEF